MRVLRELDVAARPPGQTVSAPRRVLVTSFPACCNLFASRDQVADSTRVLRVGETVDPEQLVRWLVERRF